MVYLSEKLGIKHPLIVAPMFLVSNVKMVKSAYESGGIGCLPAQNFRTQEDFENALKTLTENNIKFGVNIIVNRNNTNAQWQIETTIKYACCQFIITSLGNPKNVIAHAQPKGILVFCDVVNLEQARKVHALGADALIAVGSDAGGHSGPVPVVELVQLFKQQLDMPVIAAGGVGNYTSYSERMNAGADGVSVGTVFIASQEADIDPDYKQCLVKYGADDIVMTSRLSGHPCTVINTPYVQKIGLEESPIEKFLNKNKHLKRIFKASRWVGGNKWLGKVLFSASYRAIWTAGKSIQYIHAIRPLSQILNDIVTKK